MRVFQKAFPPLPGTNLTSVMGNVVDLSRPVHGGPPRIPKEKSWTGVTWDNFIRTRVTQPDVLLDNGYNLSGFEIPEDVLETILCMLPAEDILKCNEVCRAWKDLILRKSFWKKCFQQKGVKWSSVPAHLREPSTGWIVLYSQLRYGTFENKNYIRNPSGRQQFDGWTIYQNGGHHWVVEEVPAGCNRLPEEAFFGSDDTSCFVSSFGWCSKYTVIDLWNEGLKPTVMRLSLPFEIKCSQLYTTRFDCGGNFRWELRLLDSDEKIIQDHKAEFELPAEIEWKKAEHSFKFKSSHTNFIGQIRYLVFIHEGKDNQFWAGHYGMKFARACVTVNCLESDPEDPPEMEAVDIHQEAQDSSSDYDDN